MRLLRPPYVTVWILVLAAVVVCDASAQPQGTQEKSSGSAVPRPTAPLRPRATPLSATECRNLGCTLVEDNTCPVVVSPYGHPFRLRCVCTGGGSLCIDESRAK